MPLIIYLDTQDYIAIFNEPDDGPNRQVLAKLLTYRDHGDIVIGFSYVTVLEFITKPDASNREERVRRGQLIKDICGSNAFPYTTDLARGATFPNNGKWIYSKNKNIVSAKKFRRHVCKIVFEKIEKSENLNRSRRRQLRRKESIEKVFQTISLSPDQRRECYAGSPVPNEVFESFILERFLRGECSDAEFERVMNSWILDPSEFSRLFYDYADKANFIETMFGECIDKIEYGMEIQQADSESIRQENQERLNIRAALLEKGFKKSKARQLTKQVSAPKLDFDLIASKLEPAVGKARTGHFTHYFRELWKSGYAFKRSDVMDLVQMCYAYDCDLFRCDKAMGNTFRGFEPFEGKLVGRFAELPSRIEAALVS